ncbi:hypothetical protein DACRYDRAFT_116783 [Dacryopinax primogenitus]|uniref:Uncharacterized protein n=1 Tax=Dacryopinax primogenitus (strain DJM 731) TaxID=1858805 RepID=M5FTD5_DACPD|nr:uncharacterized protein DACRYDRAFT_116783 [Dacryopinax primogenitus]EJU00891.1 hypothetical protein DACRYDRAFT_116783 [Dacryopinax primogenitus]
MDALSTIFGRSVTLTIRLYSALILPQRKVDRNVIQNRRTLESLIAGSPFFGQLGNTIVINEGDSQKSGEVRSGNLLGTPGPSPDVGQMALQLPIKMEYRWVTSDLIQNGLNFLDSPGLGDTDYLRSAGAERALMQAAIICIVAPIERCEENKIARSLARLCQKECLMGRPAQLVFICTQCDHGIGDDSHQEEFMTEDSHHEVDSTLQEMKRWEEELEEWGALKTALEEDDSETEERPRKRARHEDASDNPTSGRMADCDDWPMLDDDETLRDANNHIQSLETSIKAARFKIRNTVMLARNGYAKKRMSATLEKWLPKMDTSSIRIFSVAAECYQELKKRRSDGCHGNVDETQIPQLRAYLMSEGETNLKLHAARLERDLVLTAERILNFFSSEGQANVDLSNALSAFFGGEQDRVQYRLDDRLAQLCSKSFDWVNGMVPIMLEAAQKLAAHLRHNPDAIFKDRYDEPITKALVSFIEMMVLPWNQAFLTIRQFLIDITDSLFDEAAWIIGELDKLEYLGNENLRKLLSSIGRTEKRAFRQRIKEAAYHCGDEMGAARRNARKDLAQYIQQELTPTYEKVMEGKGRGFVAASKELIVHALTTDDSTILTTSGHILVNGLSGYYSQALQGIGGAMQTAVRELKKAYLDTGTKIDETDERDVRARRAFLEYAMKVLSEMQYSKDSAESN